MWSPSPPMPASSSPDGEAGRRPYRGALARYFHRAEVHFPQPAFDRRHHHRIYDYLRLLFARVGEPRCPTHAIPLAAQTISQMVDQVLAQPEGAS